MSTHTYGTFTKALAGRQTRARLLLPGRRERPEGRGDHRPPRQGARPRAPRLQPRHPLRPAARARGRPLPLHHPADDGRPPRGGGPRRRGVEAEDPRQEGRPRVPPEADSRDAARPGAGRRQRSQGRQAGHRPRQARLHHRLRRAHRRGGDPLGGPRGQGDGHHLRPRRRGAPPAGRSAPTSAPSAPNSRSSTAWPTRAPSPSSASATWSACATARPRTTGGTPS